jgi:hypothetical protein
MDDNDIEANQNSGSNLKDGNNETLNPIHNNTFTSNKFINSDPTNSKSPLTVIEDNNATEKKTVCLMIQYDFNNPSDSKIKLYDANATFDGGKTQKNKRSLKPLKRKTIHKKMKFRKTPKKKHPRRRSIRK